MVIVSKHIASHIFTSRPFMYLNSDMQKDSCINSKTQSLFLMCLFILTGNVCLLVKGLSYLCLCSFGDDPQCSRECSAPHITEV